MGTSFTEYRGSGFWTRAAALETVLALLVVELEPVASGDATLFRRGTAIQLPDEHGAPTGGSNAVE